MKKSFFFLSTLFFILVISATGFCQDSHIGKAAGEGVKTSGHASKSAAHSIAGSGQATSAVSAVPLLTTGASGAASTQIGEELLDAATKPIGEPLEITDETVTIGVPPDQALQNN